MKLKPDTGLGINLEAKPVVSGDRSAELPSRHFIRDIVPEGAVGRTGLIHVDDELLAVFLSC